MDSKETRLKISRVKELLQYDSITGIFKWKENRGNVKKGDIAGSYDNKKYIRIIIDREEFKAHRLAWFYHYGIWPKNQIDHRDRNKENNAIYNLRDVTNSENHKNRGISKNNKSGIPGVCWDKVRQKWFAFISIEGKRKSLGRHDSKDEAVSVRKQAEIEYGYYEN